MEMSEEIQDMINENVVHLATTSNDGKPNVVPVGDIRAMSESELPIVEVLFGKTKKELVRKKQGRGRSAGKTCIHGYQLKGRAMISIDGEIIEGVEKRMRY